MEDKTTKGELKKLAGVRSDRALARWISEVTGEPISQQSVSKWGGDLEAIPDARHWQFRCLQLEGRI